MSKYEENINKTEEYKKLLGWIDEEEGFAELDFLVYCFACEKDDKLTSDAYVMKMAIIDLIKRWHKDITEANQ